MSLINDALKRANADKSRAAQPPAAPPNVPELQPVETPPPSPLLPWALLILGVAVLAIAAALWFRPRSTQNLAQNQTNQPAPVSPEPKSAAPETPPNLASAEPVVAIPAANEPSAQSPAVVVIPGSAKITRTVPASPEPPVSPSIAVTPAPIESTPARAEPIPVVAAAPTTVDPTPPAPPTETKATPPEPQIAATDIALDSAPPTESKPALASSPPSNLSRPPRLQAIYYRLRGPTVVINGKTLRTGQSADGIKVVSIQRTSVEVVQDGKYRTLTLQD